ncbi:MAG TPA: phosphate signaling complex protein PhoU [Candidatus Bathyarchaeia archaeon]|nr:phosphate signaling complex protein PhoU [Candidatus Bathyarchaeia archaeon]
MPRTRYVRKLKELRQDVIDMGAITSQSVQDALAALETSNTALAEHVIANDDKIDNFDRKIEAQCMTLLALEQPMAKDLRVIATSLKMITDLERIGDFTVDIAEEIVTMAKPIRIPISASKFNELVADVKSMVADSIETYAQGNVERARTFEARDDRIDFLYKDIVGSMINALAQGKCSTETVSDVASLLYIIRYLERIADHAVNIGNRVCYMEEGERRYLK